MVEPTWYPLALPRAEKRVERARTGSRSDTTNLEWLGDAAPFAVAALWAAATGAAVLLWALTGWREPLDLCRSGVVLTGAGTLTTIAVLAASARRFLKR